MTLDAHRDRTALRLKLYQNGFTPLANKSKMCLLPEWSTFDVTPERIQSKEWARSNKFLDTGIRCGDVVAIDIDIDDPVLLNNLLDEVINQKLVDESLFVRIGRPPRELWVYRTSEKIGKRTTGHFVPRGAPEDHKGFAVEILGAGCQFAAFGQRDENTAYAWPEESLLEHQYMDLPVITKAQADALKDFAIAFFEQRGLERRSPAGGTDAGYTLAYDLTPDMEFDVHDMGVMTLPEIEAALKHSPQGEVLRCKVEALRPTGGSWAGMISLVNGMVCVSDHGTYTSHFPLEADLNLHTEKLGRLLEARFPEIVSPPSVQPEQIAWAPPDDLDPRAPFDVNTALALRRYVYSKDTDQIFDVHQPRNGMKPEHFRNSMRQFSESKLGPKGGEVRTWLFDLFMDHADRINVGSVGLRPDQSFPLFREDGRMHLNMYRPLDLPTGGDARIGWEFLQNLLPIAAEHKFFCQWLSHKFHRPDVRGPGVIMVAHDQYGTGRGSLVALIRAMVAEPLVRTIDFATLSGKTYQSQYNEWLVDSLFAVVNEAKEATPNMSAWQTRNNAYEHLKAIIDPGEHHTEVLRKGGRNGPGRTYCSILVLTNHMDSVVLPHNDRRLMILENGKPMPEEYWATFRKWLAVPANVGAFRAELLQVDLAGYNPFAAPPMTASKSEMVEAGASELDRALTVALTGLADTFVVKDQILLKIEDYLTDNDAEVPDDWRRMVERLLLRRTRKVPSGVPERVRIDGRQRIVRAIGKPLGDFTNPEVVIGLILANGPLSRQIRTSGAVVAFPQRR